MNHSLRRSIAALCGAAMILSTQAPGASAMRIVAISARGAAGNGAAAGVRAVRVQPRLGAPSLAGVRLATNLAPVRPSVSPAALGASLAPGVRVEAVAAISAPATEARALPAFGTPAALRPAARAERVEPSAADAPAALRGPDYTPQGGARGEQPRAARGPLGRTLARVSKLFTGRDARTGFDGVRRGFGIREDEAAPDPGVDLDPRPAQPQNTEVPGLGWKRVALPGAGERAQDAGGVFRTDDVRPVNLAGDPQDAAGVEAALRELIRANPSEFGGLSAGALQTVLANKVEGRAGLGDMVYVNFRQKLAGVAVEGTYLDFTVKLSGGKAQLVRSTAQLYPSLAVDTAGRYPSDELLERAFDRLGRPTGSFDDLLAAGRKVMHLGGRWRAVDLWISDSKGLAAAVDVNTGEAFAWDARHRMRLARPQAATGGSVKGRGIEFDPVNTGEKLDLMPLANTELVAGDGKTFHTDKNGEFTYEGDAPVTVTARLKGRYAEVLDQKRKDLKVTLTIQPGETVRIVFNPDGFDEASIAQVNAYRHANRVHDWVVEQGINAEGIHRTIPIKVNINQDCNAFYTPWSPSLNFFFSSKRCINTAYDTVVYHEYGHFVDDVLGGIVNGGLSEGWGDILAMYITGQPILGEGFLKGRKEHWIRHGENNYQYSGSDEVHDQGQAWMGFAWKLRKNLIESLGQAQGAALANALVIPVLFANVRDIPAAIEAVLLRDVGADGRAAHFREIAAAAASHGIQLREPKPGDAGTELARPVNAGAGALAAGAQSQGRSAPRGGVRGWLADIAKRLADALAG